MKVKVGEGVVLRHDDVTYADLFLMVMVQGHVACVFSSRHFYTKSSLRNSFEIFFPPFHTDFFHVGI